MEVCPLEATDVVLSVTAEERGFWEVVLWEMVVCKGGGRMTLQHHGICGVGQSQTGAEARISGESGWSDTGRRGSRRSALHWVLRKRRNGRCSVHWSAHGHRRRLPRTDEAHKNGPRKGGGQGKDGPCRGRRRAGPGKSRTAARSKDPRRVGTGAGGTRTLPVASS